MYAIRSYYEDLLDALLQLPAVGLPEGMLEVEHLGEPPFVPRGQRGLHLQQAAKQFAAASQVPGHGLEHRAVQLRGDILRVARDLEPLAAVDVP